MSMSTGLRLFRTLLLPHGRALGMLGFWSLIEALPPLVSGLVIANAIDQGFLRGLPLIGAGWLLAFAAVQGVAAFATRRLYPWLAQTVEPLRDSLVTAVVTGSVHRAVARAEAADGASVAQATEQVEAVRDLLAALLRNGRQILSALLAIAGLALLSAPLAVVAGPLLLFALTLFALLLRTLFARQREVLLAGEHITETADPVVNGLRDVIACGGQVNAARSVGEAIDRHANAARAFARARVIRVLVLVVGVHLPLITLLALSPWLISHHYATVGVVGGAVVYLSQQLEPSLRFLINAGGTWIIVIGVVMGRLAEVAAVKPPQWTGTRRIPPGGHAIRVKEVTFAYSPDADPVLDDVSIEVPDGTHLAVVGVSGVGKSTLANVLAGVVFPERGQVLVHGIPVTELAAGDVHRDIALIPQEAYVFAGTVEENLAYLRPGVAREELDEVIDLLGMRGLLRNMGGYDGAIAPGGDGLSAGERQLIALARVLVSRARVVILDEASCHLDPSMEARVEAVFRARPGTLIVIAHRMSSAIRADRILLMDGAHPIQGTHRELLSSSSLYADLVGYWEYAGLEEKSSLDGQQPASSEHAENALPH